MSSETRKVMQIRIPTSLYFTFRRIVAERKGEYRGHKNEAIKEAIQMYVSEEPQKGEVLKLDPDLEEAIRVWCDNIGLKYEEAIPRLIKLGFKAEELKEVPAEAQDEWIKEFIRWVEEEEVLPEEVD